MRTRAKRSRSRSRRGARQHVWIHRRSGEWTFKSGVFRARVVEGDCSVKFSVSALTPSGSFYEESECKSLAHAKREAARVIAREHRRLGAEVMRVGS